MTDYYGDKAPVRQAGAVHESAKSGFVNAPAVVLWQDHVQVPSGAAINDRIFLADLPWTCVLDPDASKIHFDDAGTNATTLDIGDENDPDALATVIDIATAAGSASMLEAVDRANYHKELWELLGYADLETAQASGDRARIYATIKGGATTGAMDLFWRFVGTRA